MQCEKGLYMRKIDPGRYIRLHYNGKTKEYVKIEWVPYVPFPITFINSFSSAPNVTVDNVSKSEYIQSIQVASKDISTTGFTLVSKVAEPEYPHPDKLIHLYFKWVACGNN